MDSIQALSAKAKANPAAPNVMGSAVANDDDSAAGAFAALLNTLGTRLKPTDTSNKLDTKLLRNDDAAQARAADARDNVKKAREEKSEDRTAAKPKANKARSNEDEDAKATDDTKASENSDDTQTAADTTQNTEDQAATQVAAEVAIDIPLVTTEAVAPVLIAQQVQAVVDPAATQQAAVETTVADTSAATEIAAIDTKTTMTDTAAQEAAVIEAPAAIEKAAVATGPAFKQVVAEAAGPAQAAVTDDAATATQTVKTEVTAAKTTETAQTSVNTERSAAAQAQSQDLSQKVGPDTKAQVHVTVTTHVAAQAANTTSVYDIYAGYNGTQTSTANGQAGDAEAGNALVASKTPAEAAQAQVAPPASPALAPQPSAPQQGTSYSSARADIAAPAPTQAGNTGSQASFGESSFGASTGGNTGTQQANSTTASTPTTATERPMATAQQIIDQIKVNVTRAAKAGLDKITIQLKPIELGRIDVKLEMSEDHKVRVEVTADNKDTLALLQSDSRTLERTLNEAGLRTDTNNLHFSLRSESDAQTAQDGRNGSGKNGAGDSAGATDEAEDVAMTFDYAAAAQARGGIDTFA